MKIAVLVKPIPDPIDPGTLDPVTNTLVRPAKLIIDEADRVGVEQAIQLRNAAGEGSVVIFAMAPLSDSMAIRNALAMGADEAVQVVDNRLIGSDSLTTAKILAAAIKRDEANSGEGFDLVVAATESSDGYTGVLPAQLAAVLGRPSLTFCQSVELVGSSISAKRQTDRGYDEVTCPLPVVITVTAKAVEPRHPSFKGIMDAKRKRHEVITATDLGFSDEQLGWAGAGQIVAGVLDAPARSQGEVVVDDGSAHEIVIRFLDGLKLI